MRTLAASLIAGGFALLSASPARAGAKVFDSDGYTVEIGLRMQPRFELERAALPEWQRDFLIRRTRIKVNGKMQTASYNFEWKIDRTDAASTAFVAVAASVENAYLQVPIGRGIDVRAGLYDAPFSRDRLTSDSKQLAVDRGAVSNVPDAVGLADNVVGFDFRGKVRDGRAMWVAGLYDNRTIEGAFQDLPMVAGRIDLNFGETKDLYQDAHFGDKSWFSVGLNGNYQSEIENAAGASEGTRGAAGVDAMIDMPMGGNRLFFRTEGNTIRLENPTGGNSLDTKVWMVGGGLLLFNQRFQPFARYDQTFQDDAVGGGTRNVTYVGANLYRRGHNLKVQGDVRFEGASGEPLDGVRLQGQIDF